MLKSKLLKNDGDNLMDKKDKSVILKKDDNSSGQEMINEDLLLRQKKLNEKNYLVGKMKIKISYMKKKQFPADVVNLLYKSPAFES